jgi:glycosyltransferase involved in cell wall biosynthesis
MTDQTADTAPPSSKPEGQAPRILVFVPMYNCADQIVRVAAQFTAALQHRFTKVMFVDNRSTDGGVERLSAAAASLDQIEVDILRNTENYGLGGSHKVAFEQALIQGFDHIVVLHGDDQAALSDLIPFLEEGLSPDLDCLLGARFMSGSRLEGYSAFRTFGNKVFNLLFSLATRRRLYDLGSGLNLYRVDALKDRAWRNFPDDLTFNYYMILASARRGWRMKFFPLSWREEDQRSNVRLFRQACKVLAILLSFVLRPRNFLAADWRNAPRDAYRADVLLRRPSKTAAHMGACR